MYLKNFSKITRTFFKHFWYILLEWIEFFPNFLAGIFKFRPKIRKNIPLYSEFKYLLDLNLTKTVSYEPQTERVYEKIPGTSVAGGGGG